jgi:hypothetical protein
MATDMLTITAATSKSAASATLASHPVLPTAASGRVATRLNSARESLMAHWKRVSTDLISWFVARKSSNSGWMWDGLYWAGFVYHFHVMRVC